MTDNGPVKTMEIRQCVVSEPNGIGRSLVEFQKRGKTITRERFDVFNHREAEQAVSRFLTTMGQEVTPKQIGLWMNAVQKKADTADESKTKAFEIVRAADIADLEPTPLEPAVINGLLRFGETANINAVTKAGKSWLALDSAFAITTGTKFLGTFSTQQSPVLIIDNELMPSQLEYRIRTAAKAKQIDLHGLPLDWAAVRGKGWNLIQLGEYLLNNLEPEQYGLIILDAWYQFMPHGFSENDNAQMMELYNVLDEYADRLKSAFKLIHHTSKGSQTGKRVTDVGSGAGSMSRAADTHIAIRDHNAEGLAVFEARCRSFAPVDPFSIKFDFPLWYRDETEPALLQPKTRGGEKAKQDETETINKIAERFQNEQFTANDVRKQLGINRDKVTRILTSTKLFNSVGKRPPHRKDAGPQELFQTVK